MTLSLAQLIEKLEAATGGSAELNQMIAEADGWVCKNLFDEITGPELVWCKGPKRRILPPDYSGSIDAALTLVPENCTRATGNLNANDMYWACVTPHAEPCPDYTGESVVNEAIALCIAALRARSSNG